MQEFLQQMDVSLLYWVNQTLANPFFDAVLPWLREKLFWAPLYLFWLSSILVLPEVKKRAVIVICLLIAVGCADFTSNTIKKSVHRLRPCRNEQVSTIIQLRTDCGSGYSFVSAHAANHFAIASFLFYSAGLIPIWKKRSQQIWFLWAGLISFSQVYVGLHYPADVVAGCGIGLMYGFLCSRLLTYLMHKT